MGTEVLLVAGLVWHDVAGEVWRASPGSVLVRHDLCDPSEGLARR